MRSDGDEGGTSLAPAAERRSPPLGDTDVLAGTASIDLVDTMARAPAVDNPAARAHDPAPDVVDSELTFATAPSSEPSPAGAPLVRSWRPALWGWGGLPAVVAAAAATEEAPRDSPDGGAGHDGSAAVGGVAGATPLHGAVLTAADVWLDDVLEDDVMTAGMPPGPPSPSPTFQVASHQVAARRHRAMAPDRARTRPDGDARFGLGAAGSAGGYGESPGATLMAALAWGLPC